MVSCRSFSLVRLFVTHNFANLQLEELLERSPLWFIASRLFNIHWRYGTIMSKKKDDDGENVVLNYLTKQNRPYSMSDIAQNLHKELGKSGIQKILDKLVQDGNVTEKSYGKQKIYFINQSFLDEASPDAIKALEFQIEAAEKLKKERDNQKKELQSELRKIEDSMSTADLQKAVADLRLEVERRREKLKSLKETTVVVDKKERAASRSHLNFCVREWRTRKNKCMEVLGNILENCPTSAKELLDEIGIVTDEAADVKIPILK